jgi:glucose/mannose-6-phosphate isomerase
VSALDDERALLAGDPSGMLEAALGLPAHCREGYAIGTGAANLPSGEGVANVAFCGMGGSAVAGDVVRALYADRLREPVLVVRTPELPEWCGSHSLVVVSSYSGDTAETLACFEEASRRGCRIVAVTSGGELARRAEELGLARVVVPPGFMPRAALGYLALGSIGTLAGQLGPGVPTSVNPAKQLVEAIGERVPVVWGAEGIGSVAAARWKTQMNENGKVPAYAAALPELDHNEVVGWTEGQGHRFFLLVLRHDGEHPDVAVRFAPSIRIAEGSGVHAREVWASGRSPLARLLTLVMVGDLTSTYLGISRGADPSEIEVITRLKQELARS